MSAHPSTAELVIEVAVASPDLDRENASLYAEADVKEYWIILGSQRQVEVYRQTENGRYGKMFVAGVNDALECSSIPGLRVQVSELFT